MTFFSNGEGETQDIGRALGSRLAPGSIVALYGDLGAGKTAFVRGLAQGLGSSARVTSPTFTIVNEYDGPVPLFHFDLYRLGGPDELFEIGWDDYLERGGIVAVEWSENAGRALPVSAIRVSIVKTGENSRKIDIESQDE